MQDDYGDPLYWENHYKQTKDQTYDWLYLAYEGAL